MAKAKGLVSEVKRVLGEAWDNVGDTYQQVILGHPRFPQHPRAPEPDSDGPGFGGRQHQAEFSPAAPAAKEAPARAVDGEILPPERSPEDLFAELRATRIERSEKGGPKLPPGRAPDRDGPDFDR